LISWRAFCVFQVFSWFASTRKSRITDSYSWFGSAERLFPENIQAPVQVSLKQSGDYPAVIPWNDSRGLVHFWTASP
jgi:hypothetical protein